MKNLKPRGECQWEKKLTMIYGYEEGDAYYVHKISKEEVEDRPEDYWSENEEEVDLDEPANSHFLTDLITISTELSTAHESSVNLSGNFLEKIHDCLLFLTRCKGENELESILEKWGSALVSKTTGGFYLLFSCLTDSQNSKSGIGFCLKSLFLADSLLLDGSEDLVKSWKQIIQTATTESTAKTTLQTLKTLNNIAIDVTDWLYILHKFVSYLILFKVSGTDLQLLMLSISKSLADYYSSEVIEISSLSSKCFITFVSFYEEVNDGLLFLEEFISQSTETFANQKEAFESIKDNLLLLFNENSIRDPNPMLQSQTILTVMLYLAHDVKHESGIYDGLFSVQDVNLVLDIVLRTINNLDENDEARLDYLRILSLVIASKAWQRDKHKNDDIEKVLKAFSETEIKQGDNEIFVQSVKLSKEVAEIFYML